MPHNVSLPQHRYVFVREQFVHREPLAGICIPAVWWGISSHPGRAFGCHVLLESGAVVLDLPLHALRHDRVDPRFAAPPEVVPHVANVVAWDSFGWDIELHEPPYLSGLTVRTLDEHHALDGGEGECWFLMDWVRNAYSARPEQHKHLYVCARDDGALIALPQDRLLFREASFTVDTDVVPPIRRQEVIHSAED